MKKLERIWERDRLYPYPWFFADQVLTKDLAKITGKPVSRIIFELKKDHITYYGPDGELSRIGKQLFLKILLEPKFIKEIEKQINELGKKLIMFCLNLDNRKLDKLSNEKLWQLYKTYQQKLCAMRVWGWLPVLIDGLSATFLSDHLLIKLTELLPIPEKKNATKYFSILTTSSKLSEVRQEERARLALIKKLERENPKILKQPARLRVHPDVIKHARDFEWLTYAYIGPGMTPKDISTAIRNDIRAKVTIDKQLIEIDKNQIWGQKVKQKLIKRFKIPHELSRGFDALSHLMYLKDNRKGIYQKSYLLMDPVIQEIANRLGIGVTKVKHLTDHEVRNGLLRNQLPKNLSKRIDHCVVVTTKGETLIVTGAAARNTLGRWVERVAEYTDATELKGQTAYAGKARGIAKIVALKQDIEKLEEGEILISPATNPDLIIAMKRAAAIVTETGGITSHAAIVSRELRKPCVVGVGMATKIFKDGDLVEVDANKGTVRRI